MNLISSSNFRFSSEARLHRTTEFCSALQGRKVARGNFFIITVNNNNDNIILFKREPRLGLIISKRFAKTSVTRNTIKRVIREIFRNKYHLIPANDYVVRLYTKIFPVSLTILKRVIREEINAHFYKIIQ